MSKEIFLSRRENGLTIRYLAQPIFNDSIFPDQEGITTLLSFARNGFGNQIEHNSTLKYEYYFLFHLDDFGSGDKSEIDLLIRTEDTLLMVEIKAFTNPNDTNVKREVIRNYLKLEELCIINKFKRSNFDQVNKIIPVLLYSKPQAEKDNRAGDFNYFNEHFLYRQGYKQKEMIRTWDSYSIKLSRLDNFGSERIKEISHQLFFITWDDVYNTLMKLNNDGKFSHLIDEMKNKVDNFKEGTPLISRVIL